MNVAVVGYGYWGPNLVRNFCWTPGVKVKYVCDLDQNRLEKVHSMFPNVENVTTDYDELINDPELDAIVIATPVQTHFPLAKRALEAGKDVLVEKPMTHDSKDAEELVRIAKENKRILMVDHTFLFTGAVKKIKELVDSGSLGDILYFDSIRVNLGLFQHDVNVIWDLAPHDLSIMLHLIDKKPVKVSATGSSHTASGMENVAYMTVYYEDSTIAHFNVNWLSPIKVRQIMIGGSEKMVVYDDMENVEKVKVYDKGIEAKPGDKNQMYETLIQYRTGDMYAPKLDNTEALKAECQYFIECVKERKQPITDGEFGLTIVKVLEASEKSIKEQGKLIDLD